MNEEFYDRLEAILILEGEDGLRRRLCGGMLRCVAERTGLPLSELQERCGHDHVNEMPSAPVADLPRRVTFA